MEKLFNLFKYGFITILTSPFWLLYFIFEFVKGLGLYIFYLFKAIILFFRGDSIYVNNNDKAIFKLKKEDEQALAERRREALNDE